MNRYEELINSVEECFEKNQPLEALDLLLNAEKMAEEEKDYAFLLQVLNELIGYYRQTSKKDELLRVIGASVETADRLGLKEYREGKYAYATTLLNAANGYRSIGMYDEAKRYYQETEKIYTELPVSDDMLLAGFYNNKSLLLQELGEYKAAFESQKKALDIVCAKNAGFETAVTFANLANTAIMIAMTDKSDEWYEQARSYAEEAVKRFEERGTMDPHYCAALSALGMYYYKKSDREKAYKLFERGMEIVEKSVGRNSQYLRLKENRDMCR